MMQPLHSRALLLFVSLLLAACGGPDRRRGGGGGTGSDGGADDGGDGGRLDDFGDGGGGGMRRQCEKMDILFVIDDSGSMGEEQSNLTANFPVFVSVLDEFRTDDGRPIDYRIGVTTTGREGTYVANITFDLGGGMPITRTYREDMNGDNGALRQGDGCGLSVPFLSRSDEDVAGKFSCVANVGTTGPSVEMPLMMTQWAVADRVSDGSNAGFLRDDALLAVVILTDEDDCSRTDDPIVEDVTVDGSGSLSSAADACNYDNPALVPIESIVATLDAVKGERRRWATAVIAGPGPGKCSSAFGDAIEAVRLKEFVGIVGDNAVFSSICEGDLASALREALDTFETACQSFILR